MALIDCPACRQKISDKSQTCPHCQFNVASQDSEKLLRAERLQKYKKTQSINNHMMLATVLFVAGFGYLYWDGTRPDETQYYLGVGVSALGFIWFIINRVRLILIKKFN